MPWALGYGFYTGTKEELRRKWENYLNIDQWLSSLLHWIKLYSSSHKKVEEKNVKSFLIACFKVLKVIFSQKPCDSSELGTIWHSLFQTEQIFGDC